MSNLTEQWKNNRLEEYKKYYCKTKWFEDIFQARCYNKGAEDEWWVLKNEKYSYNNIYHTKDIEVLAPVPSYEEWQAKDEENKNLYKMLDVLNRHLNSLLKEDKENQHLKALLKECKETIETSVWGNCSELTDQIDEVLK